MKNQATPNQHPFNNSANRGSMKMQDKANVYIKMTVLGKEFPCLIDSGCETTMIPKSLVEQFNKIKLRPTTSKVWAANNTQIRINGETEVPLCLNKQCLWTTALVSEDVEEIMLGADWLQDNECVWDFRSGSLSVAGQPAITLTRRGYMKCRRILVQECQEIPPRTQMDVLARVTMSSTREPMDNVMVETRQLKRGVYIGRTLLPPKHRDLKVCVVNTTNQPQLIPAGKCLGQVVSGLEVVNSGKSQASSSTETSSDNKEFMSAITQSVLQKLPADVTEEQRERIARFLQAYEGIYSKGTFDMGRTGLVEHSVDTGGHRPIRQALRRHPRAHLDEIDRQVDGLLHNGLIEPAASPWASNVVLVKKKDGSFRLCVDYRRLNSITYKDSYPLPHIDTCLSSMNGAVWFSTLDLRSGYHNIPIKQADQDKTAFITRRGCFRYKVMPFGLTCAPSVFQRLMDLVLCGLTYEICLVYSDDIIVFSRDFDSHMERLKVIFGRLKAANLKLHMKKCCLFQQRVDFLGHVLTREGIEVQPQKVEAVQNWPAPRSLTELRSFLGLCSYYRRFIDGFADIAAPLHALTRKNAQFQWTSEQDEAFARLKERLITAPVLGMPRDEGTYYLDTDASDVGLGAVLSQDQNGREVVLAYTSRTLQKPERNYDVTRRELLAVVYGLKSYRQYLLGRQFVIRTDHSALQSLRKTPELIGQQARWQAFIEQFNFIIVHRPGIRHRNADALSRRPVVRVNSDNEESGTCAAARRDNRLHDNLASAENEDQIQYRKSMADLQQEDPDIRPILRLRLQQKGQPCPEEILSESEATKVLWGQWHSLLLVNGVLYRQAARSDGRPPVLQLIVPTVKRTEFIRHCHEGMTGGHRAFRSTLDQVRRRGFWVGWRRDVQRYCRQCGNCNSYHRGRLPRSGPLQPLITGSIMERCHVDITGPHPRTNRGSLYILTCVDAFSKWAEAFAIPNKEAKTIARVLVEQVFCRLGTPMALLTDNAGELDGQMMREICRLLDIDKQHTTYYHPETNSVAERFHGTLNAMMGRMISDNQKDWDLLLPYVMAAYRSTVHQSTNYSPNYLMFAREVRAPADLVYGTPSEQAPASYDYYSSTMEDRQKRAFCFVRKYLGKTAERMKRQYDIRVRPQKYSRGQWVLYYNPRNLQGKQQKWQRKFSPYLVIKVLPPVNYVIQKSKRSRPLIAHVDKLKPWDNDNPPKSWLTDDEQQPGSGNGDNVWCHDDVVDGGTLGIANVNNDGHSGDGAGVGIPIAINSGNREWSGQSDDVVGVMAPGMVGDDGQLMDIHGAAAEGPGFEVDVRESGDADNIRTPGMVDDGHFMDNGVVEGVMLETSGLVDNDGDGSGRYISDPNNAESGQPVGDVEVVVPGTTKSSNDAWSGQLFGVAVTPDTCRMSDNVQPRSVVGLTTSEAMDGAGDGPGRYISGPNDGDRPQRYKSGRNDDKSTDVQVIGRGNVKRKTRESTSANQQHQQRLGETGRVSDGAAIAGDPLSSVQSADRPRRTVCLPARFNDFKLL